MKKILFFFKFSFLLGCYTSVFSQGSVKQISFNSINNAVRVDNGLIVIGAAIGNEGAMYKKYNSNGDELFSKNFSDSIYWHSASLNAVDISQDNSICMAGEAHIGASSNTIIARSDEHGKLLWKKLIRTNNRSTAIEIDSKSVPGEILVVINYEFTNKLSIVRLNMLGDSLGIVHIPLGTISSNYIKNKSIVKVAGGFVVSSVLSTDTLGIIKFKLNGDLVYQKSISVKGLIEYGFGTSMTRSQNGDLTLALMVDTTYTYRSSILSMVRVDSTGKKKWEKRFNDEKNCYALYIQGLNNAKTIVYGDEYLDTSLTKRVAKYRLFDESGNIVWSKRDTYKKTEVAQKALETGQGLLLLTQQNTSYNNDTCYIVLLDKNGNVVTNIVKGNIYNDLDKNCQINGNDYGLNNHIVKIEPETEYVKTDANGNYSFERDSGAYKVSFMNLNNLTKPLCPDSSGILNINFVSNNYDTIYGANIGNEILEYRPLLKINISSGITRPCREVYCKINYQNYGTLIASNADIIVDFDEKLSPLSSSLPWVKISATSYKIQVGNLKPSQEGDISIKCTVSCNSKIGETLCVTADITPNTVLSNPSASWDKSSVKVDGYCLSNDSIHFAISNSSARNIGNMAQSKEYRLFANNNLIKKGQFKLDGNDSLVLNVLNMGSMRLEADQSSDYPVHSIPRKTIENCGSINAPSIVNTVPYDDNDNHSTVCSAIRSSYDPNEKTVIPSGVGQSRLTDSSSVLKYTICFQNTGNDTAFKIVVIDTLSSSLDIESVKSLNSSHNYSFAIKKGRALEWTFDNILLVDSTTNEIQSHGYIEFSVNQKRNNLNGTVITNKGFIYFDFNDPIITNATLNTIGKINLLGIENINLENKIAVKAFPNPFSDKLELNIEGFIKNYSIVVYDIIGMELIRHNNINAKVVNLDLSNFSPGLYLYKVTDDSGQSFTGKLVSEKLDGNNR